MRSIVGLLIPAVLLSFTVIACGEDEREPQAPAAQTQQSELTAAGGECEENDDCQSGLSCELAVASSIGIRGEPSMPSPCEVDPNDASCAKPKGKPSNTNGNPTPSTGSAPSGAPSGAPITEPITARVCTAH